jgi:hypothetical protein
MVPEGIIDHLLRLLRPNCELKVPTGGSNTDALSSTQDVIFSFLMPTANCPLPTSEFGVERNKIIALSMQRMTRIRG